MHVGQPAVDAVVAPGELGVVDAEEMQHRGVNVVDLRRVAAIERLVAPLVAGVVRDAAAGFMSRTHSAAIRIAERSNEALQ